MGSVSLADVILEVDYRLRLLLDRESLEVLIADVVESGGVRECSDGNLVDARSSSGSFVHERISEATYKAIIERHYTGYRADPDVDLPRTPVLTASLPLSGPTPTIDEWRRAESISVALVSALQAQGRDSRVTTIASGPGVLEFQLLSSADYDPRKVHRLTAPVFDAAAPRGAILEPILTPLP